MAEILSVDICFLIDLEREQRKRIAGPAHSFLKEHPDTEFRLSAVAFGEFAAGFDRPDHPRLELVRAGYEFMPAANLPASVRFTKAAVFFCLTASGGSPPCP